MRPPQDKTLKLMALFGFAAILGVVAASVSLRQEEPSQAIDEKVMLLQDRKVAICHKSGFDGLAKLVVNKNALSGHEGHGDVYPGDEYNGFLLNDDCLKVCRGIEMTGATGEAAILNGVHSLMSDMGSSTYGRIYTGGPYIWWDDGQDKWVIGTDFNIYTASSILARGSGGTPDTVTAWELRTNLDVQYVSSGITASCADGDSCKEIEISGTTGETEVLSGMYFYLQEFNDHSAYGLHSGAAYIWWDNELALWVIGIIAGDPDSVVARGSGGNTPATVADWKVQNSIMEFGPSGISSSCAEPEECPEVEGYKLLEKESQENGYCHSETLNDCVLWCGSEIYCVAFAYVESRCCIWEELPSDLVESKESCVYVNEDTSDKCRAIEMTGAEGVTEKLNGIYFYMTSYQQHFAFEHHTGEMYILWDTAQGLWVIGTGTDEALARGSGGTSPISVVDWEVRDNSAAQYGSSDISSLCVSDRDKEACQRPSDWCTGADSTYISFDCDHDNLLDNVCYDDNGNMGVRSSSYFCADSWPNGSVRECSGLPKEACQRPSNWCTDAGSTYVSYDCDGDNLLDNVCYDDNGNMGVRSSSSLCMDSWPNGSVNECPEILAGCLNIGITGATGAPAVLNGMYFYLAQYNGHNAYFGNTSFIWWDLTQELWVIGPDGGVDSSVLVRGSSVGTPDTVSDWYSRDSNTSPYGSSDISSACTDGGPAADAFKLAPTGGIGGVSTPSSNGFKQPPSDKSNAGAFGSIGEGSAPTTNVWPSDNSKTAAFGTIGDGSAPTTNAWSSDNSKAGAFGSIGDGSTPTSNTWSSDSSKTAAFGTIGDGSTPTSNTWSSDNSKTSAFGSIGGGSTPTSNTWSSDSSKTAAFGTIGDGSTPSQDFKSSSAGNFDDGPTASSWFAGLRWGVAGVGFGSVLTLAMMRLTRRRRGFTPIPSVSAV